MPAPEQRRSVDFPAEPLTAEVRLRRPVDLRLTLGPLWRGWRDPSMRLRDGEAWRATRTPDGPATLHLVETAAGVRAEAWGPGAERALEGAAALAGELDDDSGLRPAGGLVAALRARFPGLRLARAGNVLEPLVATVVEQRVSGKEARTAHAALVRALGEPAPGPAGLVLPPSPAVLAATPSWEFHRLGIERQRGDTVRRAGRSAARLEEAASMPPAAARARLMALPGVGVWTANSVALAALGDADALPLGDWNLPHAVGYALTGEPRGSDERMLELLAPYAGQRGRVLRLILAMGVPAPRFGPRQPVRDFRET